jgi:hypothetical protein
LAALRGNFTAGNLACAADALTGGTGEELRLPCVLLAGKEWISP